MTQPNLEQALIDRIQSGIDAYRNAEMFDFRKDVFWRKGWMAAMDADAFAMNIGLRPSTSHTGISPATSASQTRRST